MRQSPEAARRFSSRKTASSTHAGSNWISTFPIGISWLHRTGRAAYVAPFLGQPQRKIASAGGDPHTRAVLHQPCQGRLGNRSQDALFSRPQEPKAERRAPTTEMIGKELPGRRLAHLRSLLAALIQGAGLLVEHILHELAFRHDVIHALMRGEGCAQAEGLIKRRDVAKFLRLPMALSL